MTENTVKSRIANQKVKLKNKKLKLKNEKLKNRLREMNKENKKMNKDMDLYRELIQKNIEKTKDCKLFEDEEYINEYYSCKEIANEQENTKFVECIKKVILQNKIYRNIIKYNTKERNEMIEQINNMVNNKRTDNEFYYNDILQKYYLRNNIIDHLQQENDYLINKNMQLKNLNAKIDNFLVPNTFKKRKWFNMTFNESCEMDFDSVLGLKAKSLVQINKEMLDEYNEFVNNKNNFMLTYKTKIFEICENIELIRVNIIKKYSRLNLLIRHNIDKQVHYKKLQNEMKEKLELYMTEINKMKIKNDSLANEIEKCKNANNELKKENEYLSEDIQLTKNEIKKCKNANNELKKENEYLSEDIQLTTNDNETSIDEIKKLQNENQALNEENNELKTKIEEFCEIIEGLQSELNEYEEYKKNKEE
ncbi:hypothetical protein BDAP_002704 [Binucleata daphniae]